MVLVRIIPFCVAASLGAQVSTYPIEAAKKPIAFSIVREDPLLDQEIIKRYFPEDKVAMLMVASGGCTAAQLLAQSSLQKLTIVDPNPAQLALTQFKIHLLTLPPRKRLEILGYLPMNPAERKLITLGLCKALAIDPLLFGDLDVVASQGLDAAGRYEYVFEALREKLKNHRNELEKLFTCTALEEQVQYTAPGTMLGDALDEAFNEIMAQENLVKIFGEKATANRVQDFSCHFAERTRWYLSHHLASSSPWMAHMLLGHFYQEGIFPWLTTTCSQVLSSVHYYQGYMDAALQDCEPETYHVIHLSNIIDWLSPYEAEITLRLAYRALKPGGVVIIRQLNSVLDIPQLGKEFIWDIKASEDFLQNDRSFFYRNFFIGLKHKESLAPRVKHQADTILSTTPVIEGTFFKNLATMDKEIFKKVQSQFFFAVDYFSRPMAALVAQLRLHKDRIDIIHNIVEEHGNFLVDSYHSTTFKKFLKSIGVKEVTVEQLQESPIVTMFNHTLMGSVQEDPVIALACLGIIEYAFADISALIARQVVARGWVKKEELIHYNLHAEIDKQHAEDFFKLVEHSLDDPEQKSKIVTGLKLGAYIFNRLYEDLYYEAQKEDAY